MQLAGADKLEITSTGVSVTGTVAATAFSGDGSALTGIPIPTLTSLGIPNHDDITVDGSGNVGINTTSTNYGKFTVQNTAGTGKVLLDSYQSVPTTENVMAIYADASNGYIESYNNGYKNIIIAGSGGNVGIGTASPSEVLEVYGTTPIIQINDRGLYQAQIGLIGNDTEFRGSSGNIEFYSGSADGASSTERMRIDSSGNLLVGKTASNVAVAGAEIRPSGFTGLTVNGGAGLTIRRLTSDGELQSFFKDTTKVGSIASRGGLGLTVDSAGANGRLSYSGTSYYEWNTTRFAPVTDTVGDLGRNVNRFKDLYLSGSISDGTNSKTVADIVSGGGGLKSQQVFTSSGTWTKPAGINTVKVIVTGGGGGGGGYGGSTDMGSGGGAGGTAIKIIDVSSVSSVTVTVGAGGSGGNGGNNGSSGGASSFGSYASASAGNGGRHGNIGPVFGGAGGSGTGGDINIIGGTGGNGWDNFNVNTTYASGLGFGGPSYWGGGGCGSAYTTAPSSGRAYGSGGGASHSTYGSVSAAGQIGVVVVEEYL